MSPRISFDHELKLLKENVSDMVNRVEENYEHLFDALKSQEEGEEGDSARDVQTGPAWVRPRQARPSCILAEPEGIAGFR